MPSIEPRKSECGCGHFRTPESDPILLMGTSGLQRLIRLWGGESVDVELHACPMCWTIYAAPKQRQRRG